MNQGEVLRKLKELSTDNNDAVSFMTQTKNIEGICGVHYYNHHLEMNFYLCYN